MFSKVLVLADSEDPNQPALRRALHCVDDGGELEVFSAVYEPMLEGYLGNKEIYEPLRSRVVREHRDRVAALARAAESWGVKAAGHAVWAHPLGPRRSRRSGGVRHRPRRGGARAVASGRRCGAERAIARRCGNS